MITTGTMRHVKTSCAVLLFAVLAAGAGAAVPEGGARASGLERRPRIERMRDLGSLLAAARVGRTTGRRDEAGRGASLVARTLVAILQIRQARVESQEPERAQTAYPDEITCADLIRALRIVGGKEEAPKPVVAEQAPPEPKSELVAPPLESRYDWPGAKARLRLKVAAQVSGPNGKATAVLKDGSVVQEGEVLSVFHQGRKYEWRIVSVAGDEIAVENLRVE